MKARSSSAIGLAIVSTTFLAARGGEAPPKGSNFMSLNNTTYQDLAGTLSVPGSGYRVAK